MKDKVYLDETRKQYKANLHAHSTHSDGLLTPKEMVQAYQEHGYQILAFTEHELYTNTKKYDDEHFLVLPGIERSIELADETFHINGIGNPDSKNLIADHEYIPVPRYDNMEDVQQIINELKEKDNFVTINHPYWSCNRMEHIEALKGYDALEIYNYGCDVELKNANSEVYYDHLLWKGIRVKALATDDNHNSHRYQKGITMRDSFGGWIQILPKAFTKSAIFEALHEGSFYSSSGPEIYQYGVQGNKLFVKCSPCSEILFKTYPRRGYTIRKVNERISEATYTLRGNEKYVRIVCIDENGQKAWTNFFTLE